VSAGGEDSPRARFLAGLRAMVPPLVGTVPFGLVTGVASTAAGLTPLETVVMSIATFSGIVHIVSVQLYAAGAPLAVIVLTAAVLSLRLVMYSAGISPWLAHLPLRWKLVVSYFLTDQAYALAVVDFTHHPDRANKHWFIVGGGALSFVVWAVAVIAGVVLGAQVPAAWALDFSFALTFLALLVAVVHDRATLVAALVGGGAALVTYLLPLRLGLVTAALAGIVAAMAWNALEARWSGR
jgi:predicted branched-subunit amino acid permease